MNYNFKEELIYKISDAIDENENHFESLDKGDLLNFINKKCKLNLPLEFIGKLEEAQGDCVYEDKELIKIIDYLSKKYDLYVISNWFTKTQTERLKKMGVAKYFKNIIGADINYFKPDKRVFDVILKDYEPENCISIGDTLENDVILPLKLGMNAIWKTNKESSKYKTIKELKDLINIL